MAAAVLPIITAAISEAPAVVNLIMTIFHPDGSQTIVATLTQADANDTAANAAIQQLNAAVAAKNASVKKTA